MCPDGVHTRVWIGNKLAFLPMLRGKRGVVVGWTVGIRKSAWTSGAGWALETR
jgi:hypothetical protein